MNAKDVAKRIIRVLESRGGFDHWWDEIDEANKKEIIESIANELKEIQTLSI